MPLIQILSDLIRAGSVNPAYDSRSSEAEIQRQVSSFFRARAVDYFEQEVLSGRSNVVARLPGRDPARRIVFEAHCDTAGVDGMTISPFMPEIRAGRVYGRGACDTKAGLAAMMLAIADLKQAHIQPPCEIWVASAVDEEYSYRGVLKLCEGLEAAAAVASEPTGMRVAVANKGCLRWRITVEGKAAHSSMPRLGVNAIEQMAHVVTAFEDHGKRLQETSHPLVGSPTINVGLIQGEHKSTTFQMLAGLRSTAALFPGKNPSRFWPSIVTC